MRRSRRQTVNKDCARPRQSSTSGSFESTYDRARWCIERSQQIRRSPPIRW